MRRGGGYYWVRGCCADEVKGDVVIDERGRKVAQVQHALLHQHRHGADPSILPRLLVLPRYLVQPHAGSGWRTTSGVWRRGTNATR